jgi:hypothetical protein
VSTPTDKPITATPANGIYRCVFIVLILLNAGKALLLVGLGQPFLESDMTFYWNMGSQFAHGDWLLGEMARIHWPPGYPAFLGAIQAIFGKYAIAATPVLQISLDFGVALLTARICAKVSGNRAGALVGLLLSFLCFSRSCFAVYTMADNLFCTALVLYFASIISWLNRPSLWAAAAVGATLAFAMLVKSVAQPLCLTTLALMGYKFWRSNCLNGVWRHVAVMCVVMAALLAPWVFRNKIVFGHYVLTQFTGRALWDTIRLNPNQMPVDNSDGPHNRRLRSLLEGTGVKMDSADTTWPITHALRDKGYSDYEADKLMQAAALESIADHPAQYLAGRPLRFAWFWATPKPFFVLPWGSFYAAHELPAGRNTPVARAYLPDGQVTWTVPLWQSACEAFLKVVWHPNSFVFVLGALASAIGCVLMIWDPLSREAGLAAASVLLVISLVTTFFGWPQYRFRVPLEPIMIVTVAPAVLSLWYRGKRILLPSSTGT